MYKHSLFHCPEHQCRRKSFCWLWVNDIQHFLSVTYKGRKWARLYARGNNNARLIFASKALSGALLLEWAWSELDRYKHSIAQGISVVEKSFCYLKVNDIQPFLFVTYRGGKWSRLYAHGNNNVRLIFASKVWALCSTEEYFWHYQ